MLKNIEIQNFRGIRSAKIENLRQINILIGKNGSGKSSILEAIYLVSSCASMLDAVRRENKIDYVVSRRGGRGDWKSSNQVLWYLMDTSKNIEVKLGLNDKSVKFKVFPKGFPPVWLKIPEGYLNLNTNKFSEREDLSLPALRPNMVEKFKDLKSWLENVVLLDRDLLSDPLNVERYAWSRVAARRLDKHIVSLIKEEFEPDAEGLTYLPIGDSYVLALQLSGTTVRVDDLGDGARIALLASLILLASNPSLVLFEEPENHMHPAGLRSLLNFIFKLAGESNFQLFISTHSIELIRIAERLAGDLSLPLSIIYVERNSNGILDARSFSAEDAEILRKLGIDPRLLYIL